MIGYISALESGFRSFSPKPTVRRSPASIARMNRDGRVAALFGLFAQDDTSMRVHVMYLMTYRTSHRLHRRGRLPRHLRQQSPERGVRCFGTGI